MKRVLLVSHELTVTGAPNSLLRQAKYFLSAGFGVDVWTFKGGGAGRALRGGGPRPAHRPQQSSGAEARH